MPAAGGPWPSAATTVVGVIGDPVAHSLSPLLHNTAFAALGLDWVSVGFAVPAGGAAAALAAMRTLGLAGLSVTMPHKAAVAAAADRCTPVATRLGAANCIVAEQGSLVADNTDGEGFVASLAEAGWAPGGRRCLVLGAGGAARAVVLALAEGGAEEVWVVNRSPERGAAAAALAGPAGRAGQPGEAQGLAERADLVVNATPVGMADTGSFDAVTLVDPDRCAAGQVVADLVYHPLETAWLRRAAAAGATTVGGLGMLVHQAAAQLERWTGRPAPVAAMTEAAARAASEPAGG